MTARKLVVYSATARELVEIGSPDDLDANERRLTNLGTPSGAQDGATKAYVDGAATPLALSTDLPPSAGNTQSAGTSARAARADHSHTHGLMLSGGNMHAAASTSFAGFMSIPDKATVEKLAAGQALTLGYVTADAILETPSTPAYAASLTLDTSIKNDFVIGVLTGNLAITLSNPAAGRQGSVWVKQDGTGGRTVSFAASGYTLLVDSAVSDTNPQTGANKVTEYSYAMIVLGGTNYLRIAKAYLV